MYRLWFVPDVVPERLVRLIQTNNLFPHPVHMTVRGNMSRKEAERQAKKFPCKYEVRICGVAMAFGNHTDSRSLQSWGFPAVAPEAFGLTFPRFAVAYSPGPMNKVPFECMQVDVVGKVYVANTTSRHPWEWTVL